jgi:hypothetical protein
LSYHAQCDLALLPAYPLIYFVMVNMSYWRFSMLSHYSITLASREGNCGGAIMLAPPPIHPLLTNLIARVCCQEFEPAIFAFARQKALSNA